MTNYSTTNNRELERMGKALLDNFKGVYLFDQKIPELKEGECCIKNTDNHWIAIYRKDGKLYEYDSFGRDMIGKKYKDANKGIEQDPMSNICGQMSLSHLLRIF